MSNSDEEYPSRRNSRRYSRDDESHSDNSSPFTTALESSSWHTANNSFLEETEKIEMDLIMSQLKEYQKARRSLFVDDDGVTNISPESTEALSDQFVTMVEAKPDKTSEKSIKLPESTNKKQPRVIYSTDPSEADISGTDKSAELWDDYELFRPKGISSPADQRKKKNVTISTRTSDEIKENTLLFHQEASGTDVVVVPTDALNANKTAQKKTVSVGTNTSREYLPSTNERATSSLYVAKDTVNETPRTVRVENAGCSCTGRKKVPEDSKKKTNKKKWF